MPQLEAEDYLAEIWEEVGRFEQGISGPKRLSWQELEAWQKSQQVRLSPWESATIIAMSADFCAYFANTDRNAAAPHSPTDDPDAQAIERGHQNEYLMGGDHG